MPGRLGRLLTNARRVLSEPEMLGQYLRWLGCRMVGRRGPIVRCGKLELWIWTDFSDYWWGRRLSLLDEADNQLMQRVIQSSKRDKRTAIDVGANVGLFTLNMAGAGFTEIHSFEADPVTFTRFLRHVQGNGLAQVRANCLAVGENYGLASFVISGGAGTHHIEVGREEHCSTIQVATISLDDYCERQKIEFVDLLKIDVEGYEPWVLRGAKRLGAERRIGQLILEVCPANLSRAQSSTAELEACVASLGMDMFEIGPDGQPARRLSGEQLAAAAGEGDGFVNVVCVPRG